MSELERLQFLYDELVAGHNEVALAEAAQRAAEMEMLDTPAGERFLAAQGAARVARQALATADAELRALALAAFAATAEKHLHRAITIRVNLQMERETDEQALAWARGRPDLPGMIVPEAPNWKQIEKYARAVREIAPLAFVRWREVPVVAISLDGGA